MLTHSFTGPHTHILLHTLTLTGTLTFTHTHTQAVTHSYTHTHALKMHSHTCLHPQIHAHLHMQTHTHTPHQKGSRSQDVSSGTTGPNQKLRRTPCTQNTQGHPGPPTPSAVLPHPLGAGGAVPKPGHGWHLPGSRPCPAPARPLLPSSYSALGKHLSPAIWGLAEPQPPGCHVSLGTGRVPALS